MNSHTANRIIISLGGSLIVPNTIDTEFIARFKTLVLKHVKDGRQFVIIAGGGQVCRLYQNAATNLNAEHTQDDLDWVGIYATRLNGMLLRAMFGEQAHEELFVEPEEPIQSEKPVIIGGGWKPGWSSDYVAVKAAEVFGAQAVINMSNIAYVYDADPKENPDAKPIKQLTWQEFRTLIPDEWHPGMNAPFDPVASQKAEELGLEVAIMNGTSLENLDLYLQDKPFVGSRITP